MGAGRVRYFVAIFVAICGSVACGTGSRGFDDRADADVVVDADGRFEGAADSDLENSDSELRDSGGDGEAENGSDAGSGDGDIEAGPDSDLVDAGDDGMTCSQALLCIQGCAGELLCVTDCIGDVCSGSADELSEILGCALDRCPSECIDYDSITCLVCLASNCATEGLDCASANCDGETQAVVEK